MKHALDIYLLTNLVYMMANLTKEVGESDLKRLFQIVCYSKDNSKNVLTSKLREMIKQGNKNRNLPNIVSHCVYAVAKLGIREDGELWKELDSITSEVLPQI